MERPPLDSFMVQPTAKSRPPLDSFFSKPQEQPEQVNTLKDVGIQFNQGLVKGIPNLIDMGGAAVATLADKATGGKEGWGDTFSGYAEQAPLSKGLDKLLGTKERAAETTAGRYANAGGQALATLPFAGAKAATSLPMVTRAVASGVTGAAGADVGAPLGGYIGELVGGEDGRKVGEAAGGLAAGVGAAMLGDRALTKAGTGFAKGFNSAEPVFTPKTAKLQEVKTNLYQAAENSGTVYDKTKLAQVADMVEQKLIRSGYSPDGHPYTRQMLNRVREGQNTTLPGIDSLRQGAYKGPEGADGAFAKRIGATVAEFMDNDANLVAGAPKEGILLNRQARDANKVYEASRIADDLEREVKMRARGTTYETAATNFIRNLADDEQRMKFLTPQQQKTIEQAAVTGNFQRALKVVGALGPNRLVGAVNLGASIANPALLAGNALGLAAQVGEKGIMRARAGAVNNALRNAPSIPERAGRAVRDLMGVDNTLPPSPFGPSTPPTGAITRSPVSNGQSGAIKSPDAAATLGVLGGGALGVGGAINLVDKAIEKQKQPPEEDNQPNPNFNPAGPPPPPIKAPNANPVSATHIITEEGYEPRVYKDTKGKKTVGIGFNMEQNGAREFWKKAGISENFDRVASGKQELSEASAQKLFQFKHERAAKIAPTLVSNFSKLGENQQAALESMVYQLGPKGTKDFKNTLSALSRNNPEAVMYGVMRSSWANQTPARAKRTALMLAYDLSPQMAEKMLLEQGQIGHNELKYAGVN